MRHILLFGTFLAGLSMMVIPNASATVIGFVTLPHTNSSDWNTSVIALGASVNSTLNFNTLAAGATSGAFANGTFATAGAIAASSSSIFDGFAIPPNANTGEGIYTASTHLRASSDVLATVPAQSVTFTFASSVVGGGIFLIDYFGVTPWTITAKHGATTLGSFTSVTGATNNFQQETGSAGKPYKYFLGIESTTNDITSITVSRPGTSFGQGGDNVGLDDFRFATIAAAPIPEPLSRAALGVGVLGLSIVRRREPSKALCPSGECR
jgi:hypothetical protein